MRDKTTRIYESRITSFAARVTDTGKYSRILANGLTEPGRRRLAYYILFTFLRRQKEINECLKIHGAYKETLDLSNDFFARHLYSIALKEAGTEDCLNESIEITERLRTEEPGHAGVLNNLAESLFLLIEMDELDGPSSPDNLKRLKRAKRLIERAIKSDDYPKFHSTKSNILSYLGEHKEALSEIDEAIRNEDSAAQDYSLRVSEYRFIKAKIEIRQTASRNQQELRRAMEEAQRSNLQTLSLFVAVIGFVIGGVHLAITSTATEAITAPEAIQMLFALASAILMVISGFTLLYSSDGILRRNSRFWHAFAGAVVILLFGLAMPTLLVLSGRLLGAGG